MGNKGIIPLLLLFVVVIGFSGVGYSVNFTNYFSEKSSFEHPVVGKVIAQMYEKSTWKNSKGTVTFKTYATDKCYKHDKKNIYYTEKVVLYEIFNGKIMHKRVHTYKYVYSRGN